MKTTDDELEAQTVQAVSFLSALLRTLSSTISKAWGRWQPVPAIYVRLSGVPDQGSGPHFTPAKDKRGRVTRYRVELPHAEIVEGEHGHFEATEYAERRSGWKGRLLAVRDVVLGHTIASHRLEGERLSKAKALAVFRQGQGRRGSPGWRTRRRTARRGSGFRAKSLT